MCVLHIMSHWLKAVTFIDCQGTGRHRTLCIILLCTYETRVTPGTSTQIRRLQILIKCTDHGLATSYVNTMQWPQLGRKTHQ